MLTGASGVWVAAMAKEPAQRGAPPAGRFGAPEGLLGALVWLCSPSAGFVTGVVVPVDGGFSAFSGV